MEKVKKISKYVLNILTIISALLLGINAVEGITIPYCAQITGVIAAINGVISTYLLGQKAIKKEEQFMEDNNEEIILSEEQEKEFNGGKGKEDE